MTKVWRSRLAVGALVAAAAAVGAQAPAGSSLGFVPTGVVLTTGTCATPVPGQTLLCGAVTGLQQSIKGAPYVPLGLPSKITCTGMWPWTVGSGVTLTGCT
jgi:hypothetical protein